eukprot:CAMPEP_0116895866 /NCGR_PEP_ID=MMETSP0467-20121206/5265_1 /TAXON_ID=283647 /ORGANISM="Mesodinium pulex, Strain SPMC105" /LENGTH=46 /DNA_ID= /DNA_START= /DNA_END= /DNA_ORIENTATION=
MNPYINMNINGIRNSMITKNNNPKMKNTQNLSKAIEKLIGKYNNNE